jgi:hypothetical protein
MLPGARLAAWLVNCSLQVAVQSRQQEGQRQAGDKSVRRIASGAPFPQAVQPSILSLQAGLALHGQRCSSPLKKPPGSARGKGDESLLSPPGKDKVPGLPLAADA